MLAVNYPKHPSQSGLTKARQVKRRECDCGLRPLGHILSQKGTTLVVVACFPHAGPSTPRSNEMVFPGQNTTYNKWSLHP